jgi:hypothetical protein
MSGDSRPVRPLEQKCIEPGRWIIGGRHVRAVFEGRSRKIMFWNVDGLDGENPPNPFFYLREAREWIRNQEESND